MYCTHGSNEDWGFIWSVTAMNRDGPSTNAPPLIARSNPSVPAGEALSLANRELIHAPAASAVSTTVNMTAKA
jgi:hypothetical protein